MPVPLRRIGGATGFTLARSGTYLEHGSTSILIASGGTPVGSGAVEIARGVSDDRGQRSSAVSGLGEKVQHALLPSAIHFKYRSAAQRRACSIAAIPGRAIKIAGTVSK